MGRLIQQIFLTAALCLALPALAGAQVLQNSARGELNTLSLDLTQATVTLSRVPLIDAVNAYCTLQECCDVMREVFGLYHEAAIV